MRLIKKKVINRVIEIGKKYINMDYSFETILKKHHLYQYNKKIIMKKYRGNHAIYIKESDKKY